MTEAQLCQWFGWVQGSDVPARYVHLSGRDIDNAYDQMHGIVEPDENKDNSAVKKCPRCEELNEPKATFCQQCGFAIDQETANEIEMEVEDDLKEDYKGIEPGDRDTMEKVELLDSLLDDPDVKEILASHLKG